MSTEAVGYLLIGIACLAFCVAVVLNRPRW
jgi:hypothetical protein